MKPRESGWEGRALDPLFSEGTRVSAFLPSAGLCQGTSANLRVFNQFAAGVLKHLPRQTSSAGLLRLASTPPCSKASA